MAVFGFPYNGTYPASQVRSALIGAPMASGASGIVPRAGVIFGPSNALQVAAASGMTLSVQPGYAIVGGYQVVVDAADTITLDPSTTTARWDVVGLRLYDQEAGDSAPSRAVLWVVKGTTTTEGTFPARFLPLARVVVGASVGSITSGNITDRRSWTATAGAPITIPGAAATTPSAVGVAVNQEVWDPTAGVGIVAASTTTWTPVGASTTVAGSTALKGSVPPAHLIRTHVSPTSTHPTTANGRFYVNTGFVTGCLAAFAISGDLNIDVGTIILGPGGTAGQIEFLAFRRSNPAATFDSQTLRATCVFIGA